jgi:protein PhnA
MNIPQCPQCSGGNTYFYEGNYVCPECFFEWNPDTDTAIAESVTFIVKDANGTVLQNGDTVVTLKPLPVKGTSQSIKPGTRVRKIRLVEGDHNIDCRIEGFGAMMLKSEFVKKV